MYTRGRAAWNRGIPTPPEVKLKQRLAKLGKKMSEETKKKMSEAAKGNTHGFKKGHQLSKERVFTIEHRKRLSDSHKGEKSVLWRGGISKENERTRNSWEYRAWRKEIFERDNYTCTQCNISGVYLEADHIKSFALFPDLRFELSNGRTLCLDCHGRTENYKRKVRSQKRIYI